MIRMLALALLGLITLGCASSSSPGWTKPGATAEEANRDSADCLFSAQVVGPGRDGPRTRVDQDRYRQCMTSRGYTGESTK